MVPTHDIAVWKLIISILLNVEKFPAVRESPVAVDSPLATRVTLLILLVLFINNKSFDNVFGIINVVLEELPVMVIPSAVILNGPALLSST